MRAILRIMAVVSLTALAGAACDRGSSTKHDDSASAKGVSDRCPHEIKREKCPFCNPQLVTADGYCAEHGVAEALCYHCRPYLKAAFRAKGDWCKEHDAPDSQCVVCHPELKAKMQPGAGHGDGPRGG